MLLAAGVNSSRPPSTTTLPAPLSTVALLMRKASPSTSVSLASTSISTGVSSSVPTLSATATGASLTGVIVTDTLPVSLNLPSDTTYRIVAPAVSSAAGVKSSCPPLMTTAPAPLSTTALVMVRASPSASVSLASASIRTGVSSSVVALSATATGASLTAVTATDTLAVSVRLPSETT